MFGMIWFEWRDIGKTTIKHQIEKKLIKHKNALQWVVSDYIQEYGINNAPVFYFTHGKEEDETVGQTDAVENMLKSNILTKDMIQRKEGPLYECSDLKWLTDPVDCEKALKRCKNQYLLPFSIQYKRANSFNYVNVFQHYMLNAGRLTCINLYYQHYLLNEKIVQAAEFWEMIKTIYAGERYDIFFKKKKCLDYNELREAHRNFCMLIGPLIQADPVYYEKYGYLLDDYTIFGT
jgi:hypothetical protein